MHLNYGSIFGTNEGFKAEFEAKSTSLPASRLSPIPQLQLLVSIGSHPDPDPFLSPDDCPLSDLPTTVSLQAPHDPQV